MGARTVQLLGSVQVHDEIDKVPRFRSKRAMAILGYLAVERRAIARDALTALFYPDEAYATGRGVGRRDLYNLGQVLPDCWLVDRDAVEFQPSEDVHVDLYRFETLASSGRLAEATELAIGEFLEGITLDENLEFDSWLLGERQRWRHQCEALLRRLVEEQQSTTACRASSWTGGGLLALQHLARGDIQQGEHALLYYGT